MFPHADSLDALTPKHALDIWLALDAPQTASDIAATCDVPQATLYRRLDDLENAGLIEAVDKIQSSTEPPVRGSDAVAYVRTFDALRINARADPGHVLVPLSRNEHTNSDVDALVERFRTPDS